MKNTELLKVLDSLEGDITNDVKAILGKNIFTGQLINYMQHKRTKAEGQFTITFSFKKYGLFLDKGTKGPRKPPPIKAIKPWAESKGLNPWAVQKSIAKKGTKPHPWIYKIDALYKMYLDDIRTAMRNDIVIDIKRTMEL